MDRNTGNTARCLSKQLGGTTTQQPDRMKRVLNLAARLGITEAAPKVLADAGNFIVLLEPYSIVARMPYALPNEDPDALRESLAREIQIARHLHSVGVPAIEPSTYVDPGPHQVENGWVALWSYAEPAELSPLDRASLVGLVLSLGRGLRSYLGQLPPYGAWGYVSPALAWLEHAGDLSYTWLLRHVRYADSRIRNIPAAELIPAHGDAHIRNLLPTVQGWIWADLEDASLMPKWWDLASTIGNTALFEGIHHPLVEHAFSLPAVVEDLLWFAEMLWIRCVFATATNLFMAARGRGDRLWAEQQLEALPRLLEEIQHLLNAHGAKRLP